MTMVVVVRPLDLPQAQVAASALRSAGLHPVLFDENQNYANWINMYAIGGCRVAVPESEAADALAILEQSLESVRREEGIDRVGWGWRTAAGLLGLGLLWPELGWLVLGVRSRQRGAGDGTTGFAVTAIGSALLLAMGWLALTLLWGLANPNGSR